MHYLVACRMIPPLLNRSMNQSGKRFNSSLFNLDRTVTTPLSMRMQRGGMSDTVTLS